MGINPTNDFYCPRCQLGRCRQGRATYAQLQYGMMITAPDMAAYVCDSCGYREFDEEALRQLQTLIGTETPTEANVLRLFKTPSLDVPETGDPQQPPKP